MMTENELRWENEHGTLTLLESLPSIVRVIERDNTPAELYQGGLELHAKEELDIVPSADGLWSVGMGGLQ